MATIIQYKFPKLRPAQTALYTSMKRFNRWVCHRRFGKTALSCASYCSGLSTTTSPTRATATGAPLPQAKAIAWDLLKRLTKDIPDATTNESELRVDLPDAPHYILGADNPDALRGLYLDGAVFDEYAQIRPRIWGEIVRPALADREGWAIILDADGQEPLL